MWHVTTFRDDYNCPEIFVLSNLKQVLKTCLLKKKLTNVSIEML